MGGIRPLSDMDVPSTSGVVRLLVGGRKFTTSVETLTKDPGSMLTMLFRSCVPTRRDEKGRIFIDRDPKHFNTILNFLRDGSCVLPESDLELEELLREANFYQLEGLQADIMSQLIGENAEAFSAQRLRNHISHRLQCDQPLKEALDLVIWCAFGVGPRSDGCGINMGDAIPPRSSSVQVSLREVAFNPLFPQPRHQQQDETLYVAFQQDIRFQGCLHTEQYDSKHECQFMHEEGGLSYCPNFYGNPYPSRFHIKTLQVYQHHCINSLGEHARRLRNAAVYMVEHQQNVTWALELWGFKDVAFKVEYNDVVGEDCNITQPFSCHQPVLCNIKYSLELSL